MLQLHIISTIFFDDSIFMAKRIRIGLGTYDVLLDNQATVSVFKSSELLRNITPLSDPFSIGGLAGDVEVKHEGKTREFWSCWLLS